MKLTSRTTSQLTLLGIMLLAIGLRVLGLQKQSFTADELAEIGIARTMFAEILHTRDGFPPLYHFILHGWLNVFDGDFAARWLSLLFGVLAVLAVWRLAPALETRKEKVAATLLLALSPFHIWYSQEARAYGLYFLLALLAMGFFLRAWRSHRTQDWIAYGLAGIAGLFTHYFFVILLALNAALFILFQTLQALKRPFVTVHAAFALCGVAATWLLLEDFSYQGTAMISRTPFSLAAVGYTYFTYFVGYSLGPSLRELHFMNMSAALPQFLPWLLLLSCGLLALIGSPLQAARSATKAPNFLLGVWMLVPSLGCGILAEILQVSYKPQYVLWSAIPVLLGLGKLFAHKLKRWPTQLALGAFVLLFSASLYNRNYVARYLNEDTQALARYLQDKDTTPAVLVMAAYMENTVRHYLKHEWAVQPLPAVGKKGEGLEQVLTFIKTQDQAQWLIYTRPFHGDPGGRFKAALFENGLVKKQIRFPGIELYQFR